MLANPCHLMVTIPHSGENIPPEASWLQELDEVTLMGDVDRFVDRLYEPSLVKLGIPRIKTDWHRYAADLNRLDTDIDIESVEGCTNPAGTFPRGFHWVYNTKGERILKTPLSRDKHQQLVNRVYLPFHLEVQKLSQSLLTKGEVVHLDLHSMPSQGTAQHRDPGALRKDIVISDSEGKSCNSIIKDLVILSFQEQGFSVGYNWPYSGGRLTESYGRPEEKHHVLQIELNRSLYMNELSKQLNTDNAELISRLFYSLRRIKNAAANQFARV